MRKKYTYIGDWDKMPPTLSPEEVAFLLNRTVRTVRKNAREKTLPAAKVGKSWVFSKNEIRKIVEGGVTDEKSA